VESVTYGRDGTSNDTFTVTVTNPFRGGTAYVLVRSLP